MRIVCSPDLGEDDRFLKRQMVAWLWTLSFPTYCALVRLLLVRCGYSTVRALHSDTAEGGGIDLLAFCHTDLSTFVTAVSIKTGRVPVTRRLADEMRGAMQRANAEQGLIFATGSFSCRTRRVAHMPYLASLRLIDGETLAVLLIERGIGVRRKSEGRGEWQFDSRFFEQLERRASRLRE